MCTDFLRNLFKTPVLRPMSEAPVDLTSLRKSFSLLQSTSAEVSQIASETAVALQQRLRASESRFTQTINSLNELIIIKDATGRWKKINKFGCDLFGWSESDYKDKTNAELANAYPRYRKELISCGLTDDKAWATRQPYRYEVTIKQGDGLILDIIKTPTFDENGNRKELLLVGRDITAVHEKRKRDRACFTAMNAASDCIVIIDAKGKVFFSNDRFVDTFGHGTYADIAGKSFANIVPELKDFDHVWRHIRGNKTWTGKYNDMLDITILPMMNGVKYPVYYICTFKARPVLNNKIIELELA